MTEVKTKCHNVPITSHNLGGYYCTVCGQWVDELGNVVEHLEVSQSPTKPKKSKKKKAKAKKKESVLGGDKLDEIKVTAREITTEKDAKETLQKNPIPEILDKKQVHEEDENRPLNARQELFCQLYATTREFFGNGVQSYIEAYNPDTSKKNWYQVAKASAYENLTKPHLLKRIRALMDIYINDEVVDKELASVILQSGDLSAKVSAIKEYNQLKSRVRQKIEIEDTRETTALREGLSNVLKRITEGNDNGDRQTGNTSSTTENPQT
jgi:hypothetical protein